MFTEIFDKKSGSHETAANTENIAVDRPSVVHIKLSPEDVAKYDRRGDDLVLILEDGQEILITGFFVKYDDGEAVSPSADSASSEDADQPQSQDDLTRSDLVLEDENGVMWWGQYPHDWTAFHFTEIEWDDEAFVLWPWLLGALGAVGGAALALGKKNAPPVANDDTQQRR